MVDEIPKPPEKSELDAKTQDLDIKDEELKSWIKSEVPYTFKLKSSIQRRDSCETVLDFESASHTVAITSMPVILCQRNIERIKNEMLGIVGSEVKLLERYLPSATPRPLQSHRYPPQ